MYFIRNNKETYFSLKNTGHKLKFCSRTDVTTLKLQQLITNTLRYKYDPSKNVVNLLKLLNKNLNLILQKDIIKVN